MKRKTFGIRIGPRFRRWAKRIMISGTVLVVIMGLAVYLEIKDKVTLISPVATPFFEDYQGRYISEGWGVDSPKGFWPVDGSLPHRVKAAFIAIEDKRFEQHSGVDWYALGRALVNNLSGKPRHGASTIAMQVARMQNPGKRTYWKKFCETITARLLVSKYGRDAVMRQYLRLVPQGNRIHGVSYAARRYFRKPLQDLGWAEAAILASLPKSPGRMNLFSSKGFIRARKRAEIVLALLFRDKQINAESYRVSLRHLRAIRPPMRETRPYHSLHAIANIEESLKQKGITTFNRPVRTSLDLDLQEYLSTVSMQTMKQYRPLGAGNMAMIVIEKGTLIS